MILIFVSTELKERAATAIESVERLQELVTIYDTAVNTGIQQGVSILVTENGISVSPDWYNAMPPVLFPPAIPFTEAALLGIVFCQLHNFEAAYPYLQPTPGVLQAADILNRLLHNVIMDDSVTTGSKDDFVQQHNLAIALQYGSWQQEINLAQIESTFNGALALPASDEYRAFTIKHFASFLTDINRQEAAAQLVEAFLFSVTLLPAAETELKSVLCSAWMKQLTVPYDTALLEKLKATLWECLQQYEAAGRQAEAALLLIDASQVANISNSFTESLGYINRAIEILRKEELADLLGSAQLRKGMLLYTWAQNGQPQFYRTALQALQEALQTFDRESAPDVFAEIHHHLGVIYSEIQDEVKKKAMWAAVSVSSFTEALNFYNKVDYPYEFSMICHNFGNAYTRYPAALHSDNFDKALAWYREALDIRTADHYPLERCNTLYNYLEASWHTANPDETFNEDRFNEMWAIANELRELSFDQGVKAEAAAHIDQLIKLKANFSNPVTQPSVDSAVTE